MQAGEGEDEYAQGVTAAAAVALFATGGTASADTGTQQRTIATAGASDTTVARTASQGAVDAAYRTALSQVIAQARAKAEFIALKIGATLGRKQTVTEGDGFVDCGGDAQSVSGVGQQKSSSPADSAAPAGGQTHGRLRLPPVPKTKQSPRRNATDVVTSQHTGPRQARARSART